jgi:hypothetical protein
MGCVAPGADGGGAWRGVGTEGYRWCSRWRRSSGWGGWQRAVAEGNVSCAGARHRHSSVLWQLRCEFLKR